MKSDICIYGGTSGGVIAAVASAKLGRSVILIEPGRHLGGMSSGGLGQTDIGNKAAIGGMARDFYRRIGKVYGEPETWMFEPHVAEKVFADLIAEANADGEKIRVLLNHRIGEVEKAAGRIGRIELAHVPSDDRNAPAADEKLIEHVIVESAMYIDAGYEGDLMARAKVGYTVGRESSGQYGESLNGIRAQTPKHQFIVPVDPYVKPGEPSSGLLPLIQEGDGGKPGDGDHRVQTYNFRLCITQNKENQIPIGPPAWYDPDRYEILGRYFEALQAAKKPTGLGNFMKIDRVPNGKTDINNNGPISTDFIGMNWDYPDGDPALRARSWHAHLDYIQGFLHYLATGERVPMDVRKEMRSWGLSKDEFTDTGGWPHQMYVREARRMIGPYVVTQSVCEHKTTADDAIGLAAYNMDSHNCQRIVQNGTVRNEGDVQVAPAAPYPISYRAITPKKEECENLLVPVCLSASHIAYGSIRMEPVFMLLAQSAATAAHLAMEKKRSVQDVDAALLQGRLLEAGQILKWTAPIKKTT
jgi:FAD dependent oxidoreductase